MAYKATEVLFFKAREAAQANVGSILCVQHQVPRGESESLAMLTTLVMAEMLALQETSYWLLSRGREHAHSRHTVAATKIKHAAHALQEYTFPKPCPAVCRGLSEARFAAGMWIQAHPAIHFVQRHTS